MSAGASRQRLRVLFLEDKAEEAETWIDLLRYWGYEVAWCQTAEAAEDVAKNQHLHMALLDKSMAGPEDTRGLEAARRIRQGHRAWSKDRRHLPIIVLTAYMPSSSEVAWWLSQAGGGMFDFIDKNEALNDDRNGNPRLLSSLRAAERVLALNRNIVLRGGPLLPSEAQADPVSWLAREVQGGLEQEERDGVDRSRLRDQVFDLFAGVFGREVYTHLDIGRMPYGRSGAVVLTVVPWRRMRGRTAKDEIREITCILKIGSRRKLAREREATANVQDLVQGKRIARVIGDGETRDLGALRLEFIGLDLTPPQTFEQFYVESDSGSVAKLLQDDLFGFVLQLMHRQVSRPETPRDVGQVYRPTGSTCQYAQKVFETLFPEARGQRFVELRSFSPQRLRTFVYELDEVVFPADFCWDVVCHGDLHGGNVLVYDDQCWLIDLAHAVPAPFLTDFISLETWLLFDVVAATNSSGGVRLAELLAGIERSDDIKIASLGDPELLKAAAAIMAIRDAALQVSRRTWSQLRPQYYTALFFAALRRLRSCDSNERGLGEYLLWTMNQCLEEAGGKYH